VFTVFVCKQPPKPLSLLPRLPLSYGGSSQKLESGLHERHHQLYYFDVDKSGSSHSAVTQRSFYRTMGTAILRASSNAGQGAVAVFLACKVTVWCRTGHGMRQTDRLNCPSNLARETSTSPIHSCKQYGTIYFYDFYDR